MGGKTKILKQGGGGKWRQGVGALKRGAQTLLQTMFNYLKITEQL